MKEIFFLRLSHIYFYIMQNMRKNSSFSISLSSAGIHFAVLTVKINLVVIGHMAVAKGEDRTNRLAEYYVSACCAIYVILLSLVGPVFAEQNTSILVGGDYFAIFV